MSKLIDIESLKLIILNRRSKIFPNISGVYLFFDENKKILYIGKAKNLKNRLSSYFLKNLHGKTKKMMSKAKYVSYISVNSEIESLLLEAKLIKNEKPPYNLELRDDKNPLYIRITNEKYPRVLTARKIDRNKNNKAIYGPFPSSGNVKSVLRLLRKIFPYSTHKLGKRGCLHSQIGLCNPCPNIIVRSQDGSKVTQRKKYLKNIYYIKKFLDGDFKRIKKNLNKEMDELSKNEYFEKAIKVKEKLEKIEYITQPIVEADEYVKNPNLLKDIRKKEIKELKSVLERYLIEIRDLKRIECYDVSHIQGSFPTASMVTFIDGVAEKSLYRRFKIFQKKKKSDTDSLEEVAIRRKKHFKDWGNPDLIIVDGGKGQVSSFINIIGSGVSVIGIAKKEETLIVPIVREDKIKEFKQERLKGDALHLVQRLRDEAHRFSRKYHHKLIEMKLFRNIN